MISGTWKLLLSSFSFFFIQNIHANKHIQFLLCWSVYEIISLTCACKPNATKSIDEIYIFISTGSLHICLFCVCVAIMVYFIAFLLGISSKSRGGGGYAYVMFCTFELCLFHQNIRCTLHSSK